MVGSLSASKFEHPTVLKSRFMQRERLGEDTTAGKIEGLEKLREAAAHPASEKAVERRREKGKMTSNKCILGS